MSDFNFGEAGGTYMHWFGPATFLRCPFEPNFRDTDIGLVGVPYCGGNLVERMQYLAPRAVRNRSMGYARAHREFGINPFELMRVRDLGDVPLTRALNLDLAAADFEDFFAKIFAAGIIPISIGGDHSITWPILRAARQTRFSTPLAMIHFDSHTDAYPAAGGTRNTAAGFRLGVEDGVIDAGRTVQIGIRGPLGALNQDEWAEQSGFRIITTEEFVTTGSEYVAQEVRRIIGNAPVYLSFDLDALDPAYAPGVADPELDGLTLREVRKLLHGLRGINLMGAEFVCYCPPLDNPSQITALTISLLMLEAVSLIADRERTSVARKLVASIERKVADHALPGAASRRSELSV
jgi:guanidinopropionase